MPGPAAAAGRRAARPTSCSSSGPARSRPGYDPDEAERARISEIVRRLDGLPLAIELAAARLHTIDVAEVADGLDRRFRLLAAGPRTSSRHRSLGAAVEWSFDLLADELQGVFADSRRSRRRSRPTAPPPSPASTSATAADALDALTERSLVMRAPGGRYVAARDAARVRAERLAADGRRRASAAATPVTGRWIAGGRRPAARVGHHGPLRDRRRAARAARGARLAARRTARSSSPAGSWRRSATRLPAAAPRRAGVGRPGPGRRPRRHAAHAPAAGDERRCRVAARRPRRDGGALDRALDVTSAARRRSTASVAQGLGDQALFEGRLDDAVDAGYRRRATVAGADREPSLIARGTAVLALAYAGDPTAAEAAARCSRERRRRRDALRRLRLVLRRRSRAQRSTSTLARQRLARAIELAERSGDVVRGRHRRHVEGVDRGPRGDPHVAAEQYRRLLDHWRRAGMWSTQWTMLRAVAGLLAGSAGTATPRCSSAPSPRRRGTACSARTRWRSPRSARRLRDDARRRRLRRRRSPSGRVLDGDAAVEHALERCEPQPLTVTSAAARRRCRAWSCRPSRG